MHRKVMLGFLILEILYGIILLIFGGFELASAAEGTFPECRSTEAGQGIWCGVLTLAMGSIGMLLWRKTTKITHLADVTVAAITLLATFVGFIINVIAAARAESETGCLNANYIIMAFVCSLVMFHAVLHLVYGYKRWKSDHQSSSRRHQHSTGKSEVTTSNVSATGDPAFQQHISTTQHQLPANDVTGRTD